jgi:hypothetical protein
MPNDFSAGRAGTIFRFIIRAIIDHQDMIEPVAGPPNHVGDMFLLAISRNNRGDGCSIASALHSQRTTG